MTEIRNDLLASTLGIAIGFIDSETLTRWREISAELLVRPPTWDRFGVIASRHLKAYGVESLDEQKLEWYRQIQAFD